MDFSDMFSKYMNARVDQATQPFTDPSGYMANRLGLDDNPANVTPKSTTINHNEDGTQDITHKFNVAPVNYGLTNQAPAVAQGGLQMANYTPATQAPVQPQAPAQQPNPFQAAAAQQGYNYAPVPTAPISPQQGQQIFNGQPVPSAMSGMPQQPAAGMFPAGAQAIPAQPQAPANQQYINAIQQNETGGIANPNAAVGAAGERGAMQVMPGTAMNPGFGVKPAVNNSPEELNRVGKDYYNAMLARYNNDPRLAAAAYNAGPGRMDAALRSSQQSGLDPMLHLPNGTQEYVKRFEKTINHQPGITAEQNPAAQKPWELSGTGIRMPGQEVERQIAQVNAAKSDPQALQRMALDPSTTPMAAKLATDLLGDHYVGLQKTAQADKTLMAAAQGDPRAQTDLMRDLKKNTSEGSYLRAIFFARMGLNDLAKDEQQKLGAGNQTSIATLDNKQYAIKLDGNNNITNAYNELGESQDAKTIARLQASGLPVKGVQQHAQLYGDPTGQVKGNFVLETRPGQTPLYKEISTGRLASPQEAAQLKSLGVAGTYEQMYQGKYAQAGGGAQGKAGAEGYTLSPLGQAPGMAGTAATSPVAAAQTQTAQQAVPGGMAAPAQPSAARPTAGAGVAAAPVANPNSSLPLWQQKQQNELAKESAAGQIKRGTQRNEAFDKIIDTEYRDNAAKGETVVNSRKNQFGILARPDENGRTVGEQLAGLYNAANQNPGDQKLSIVRDIFGGIFKPETEVSNRLAQLDLTPKAKAALIDYNAENAKIAAQTLRETSGPGSVSDAEQAANRARAVDITKTPMLGVYQMMGQSQFNGDLARYKHDIAADATTPNAAQFEKKFRIESSRLVDIYRKTAEDRLKYIQDRGNTPQAIREGYRLYPAPEYDPATAQWKYLKPLGAILGK